MRRYIFLLFIIGVGFSVEDVQKEHVVLNWEVLTQEDGSISANFQDAFYEAEKPSMTNWTESIISMKLVMFILILHDTHN